MRNNVIIDWWNKFSSVNTSAAAASCSLCDPLENWVTHNNSFIQLDVNSFPCWTNKRQLADVLVKKAALGDNYELLEEVEIIWCVFEGTIKKKKTFWNTGKELYDNEGRKSWYIYVFVLFVSSLISSHKNKKSCATKH